MNARWHQSLAFSLGIALSVVPGISRADDAPEPPSVAFEERPDGLRIVVGGKPFASYQTRREDIPRPFLDHLRSPLGVQVTRNNPPVEEEDIADHPTFHPGLWLAFGDLSGADSWRNAQAVRVAGLVEPPRGGPGRGGFASRNEYLNEGRVIAEEVCRLTVLARPAGTLLIWDSEFFPTEEPLAFGDQEEMGLGIRVASPLAVANGGRILDAEGRIDEAEVWGQQANWCSYSGRVDGKRAGLLLMPDPANPLGSWYHARDYGLLVANPFGRRAFTGRELSRVVVEQGETLRFRFGVLVFDGEPEREGAYQDFLEVLSELRGDEADCRDEPTRIGPAPGSSALRPPR
jgi:hypothetical protein